MKNIKKENSKPRNIKSRNIETKNTKPRNVMTVKKDIVPEYSCDNQIRLNKYLSDAGICSRRQADRLIEE